VHAEHEEALRNAAKGGYLGIVKLLVARGANYLVDDEYPFHAARRRCFREVVGFLKSLPGHVPHSPGN
jgi:hypothetical protein